MKKEEFPTFLNEQPTVIFGRTARELLFMACGLVVAWMIWVNVYPLMPNTAGLVLTISLMLIVVILFFTVALLKVGYRTLEEWLFAWLVYILLPKIYIYKPLEEDTLVSMGETIVATSQSRDKDAEEDE